MLRCALLTLICFLLYSTTARACTLAWGTNYGVYSDRLSAFLESDETSIYVIKTNVLREYEDEYKVSFSEPGVDRVFLDLELEPVETLFGGGPDSSDLKMRKAPKFSEKESANETARAAKPKPFGFWDQFSLSSPMLASYGTDPGSAACGFRYLYTLDADTYYLVFKDRYDTRYEVLTGPDDSLISEFRDVINGTFPSKTRRSAEDFFKHIDGYSEVAISSCPIEIGDRFNTGDLVGEKAFREIEAMNVDLRSLKMEDFYTYLNWISPSEIKFGYSRERSKNRDICTVGNRYLVITDNYGNPRRTPLRVNTRFPAQLRFLKIENGSINAASVISNIKIETDGPISVDQIKFWIGEANQESISGP